MESGNHSEWSFDLDKLFQAPADSLEPGVAEYSRRLGPHRPDAVYAPMTGGATLAERIVSAPGVSSFFTERREQPEKTGRFPVEYTPDGRRM